MLDLTETGEILVMIIKEKNPCCINGESDIFTEMLGSCGLISSNCQIKDVKKVVET